MADNIYLRPLGIIRGSAAGQAIADGIALPLCGGPAGFVAAELIEGTPGATTRTVARVATLKAIEEPVLQSLIARITAPRPTFAGIPMDGPAIMGILNVTPDSFSDGGRHNDTDGAFSHALALIAQGAAIIDVGGESTRPGAETVSVEDERARVIPVLERLKTVGSALSIDTRKAAIMTDAAAAGAAIINDVSALSFDPESVATAARLGLPTILMHAQGDPKTMQDNPTYADVLLEVYDYLQARIDTVVAAGLPREKLCIDPGIGFGKTFEHNLALIEGLSLFHGLGVPILVGISRKGVTGQLAKEADPQKRDFGSAAAAVVAAQQGVQIIRVHNVEATRQSLAVWQAASTGRNV